MTLAVWPLLYCSSATAFSTLAIIYFTREKISYHWTVCRIFTPYCAPVWHYAINRAQAEQLESIQKRAIRIIFPFTRGLSYSYTLFATNLISLDSRRHDLSKSFFQDICEPSSCIHPSPRDTSVLSRLRSATPLPRLTSRTKKHCSFITYALNRYQIKVSN